jgi:hypothetical protein
MLDACDPNINNNIRYKRNSKLTNYFNIFDGTYWGAYSDADPEIIDNRNKFVEEFNIIKSNHNIPNYILTQLNPEYICKVFKTDCMYTKNDLIAIQYLKDKNIKKEFHTDHREYYESEDLWIGIFSVYNMDEEDHEYALNFGYELYDELYIKEAITYIKIIPKCIKYKNTNKIFKIV